MRKKMALFMALVFILNLFLPKLQGINVFGATPMDFRASTEENLETATNSPIPRHVNVAGAKDQILFEWKMGNDTRDGTYVLSYFISDNRKVEFTVVKEYDNARAEYHEYAVNAGQPPVERFNSYNLYDQETGRYIKYSSYLLPGADVNYNFENFPQEDTAYPSFAFDRNRGGFSFQRNGMTVLFLWDGESFRYVTDKMDPGFIFEITLKHYDDVFYGKDGVDRDALDNLTPTESEMQKVITGINESSFSMIPVSGDNDNTTNDFVNSGRDYDLAKTSSSPSAGDYGEVDTHPIEQKTSEDKSEKTPGKSPNGIIFRFDLPRALNETTFKFDYIPTDKANFTATIELAHTLGPRYGYNFTLGNITEEVGKEKYTDIKSDTNYRVTNREVNDEPFLLIGDNKDRLQVWIEGFDSGLLFSETNVGLTVTEGSRSYVTRTTALGFAKTYTFLEYEIIPSGEQYMLRFMPYKNYSYGTYYLYSQPLTQLGADIRTDANGNLPKAEIKCKSDSELMVFPLGLLTTSENGKEIYNIKFEPEVTNSEYKAFSQKTLFWADKEDATVSLPSDFSVWGSKLTPSDEEPKKQGVLDLILRWSVASRRILETMIPEEAPGQTERNELNIRYRLNSSLQIDRTVQENYADVLLTIFRNPNHNSSAAAYEDKDNPFFQYEMLIEYKTKDAFGETTLYETVNVNEESNNGEPLPLMYTGTNLDSRYYYIMPEFKMLAKRQDVAPTSTPYAYFVYPNVYFLNLGIISVGDRIEKSDATTAFVSVTLDDMSEMELPPPENVNVTNTLTTNTLLGYDRNEVSGDISFTINGRKVKEYIDMSYAIKNNLKMQFNIYISTNQDNLVNETAKNDGGILREIREESALAIAFNEKEHGATDEKYNGFLNFSLLNDKPTYATESAVSAILTFDETIEGYGKQPAINALRDGKTVMIKGLELSAREMYSDVLTYGETIRRTYKFDGLDKNQKYYVYVDFLLDNVATGVNKDSPLSSLAAFTTEADRIPVNEGDKQPSSPTLSKKEVSLDRATIYWDEIPRIETDGAYDIIEYQIVRIKDRPIAEEALDITEDFSKFWGEIPEIAERKGFETDSTNPVDMKVMSYNPQTGFDGALTKGKEYDYKIDAKKVNFTDIDLKPNQVYYYYVRTVRTTVLTKTEADGSVTEISRSTKNSVWSHISVTTTVLQKPENLVVDRSDRDAYDAKAEAILAFDAPITNLDYLGPEYKLQYIIQKDNEPWSEPQPMDETLLKSLASTSLLEGYTNFRFKVEGLEPDTNYRFMVRLVNAGGDASMYSNMAETRTDHDEGKYEEEYEKGKWDDYLKEKLRELLKNHYWLSDDTNSRMTAVYRPTMFDSLMSETVGGKITLADSEKNASRFTYYLPASVIIAANANNMSLAIEYGGMEIALTPNSFDPNVNTTLHAMIRDVNNERTADYYVRVNAAFSNETYIDGNETATPVANISFEAVGTDITALKWDEKILSLLSEKIESEETINEAKKRLYDMIESNAESEEIVRYINDYVEIVRDDFTNTIYRELRAALDYSESMNALNSSMIISAGQTDETESLKGYGYIGEIWIIQETTRLGDRAAMYSDSPGSYVFTKYVLDLKGLDTIAGSYGLTALIAKYGLDDFLGKGGAFDINGNATGYMVTGIVSRVTGAPKGTEPYSYLSTKGLNVSSRTQYANISNQEAIYLLTYIYEQKTNSKISTLTIRNYSLTANISGLDDRYKKSVQAAYQLELYDNPSMQPRDAMTVRDLLEFLKKLNNKVKL